jgi:hypothetical protein
MGDMFADRLNDGRACLVGLELHHLELTTPPHIEPGLAGQWHWALSEYSDMHVAQTLDGLGEQEHGFGVLADRLHIGREAVLDLGERRIYRVGPVRASGPCTSC